jgi:hypothetical protein
MKKVTLIINPSVAKRILNNIQPGKSITGSAADLNRILGLPKGNNGK